MSIKSLVRLAIERADVIGILQEIENYCQTRLEQERYEEYQDAWNRKRLAVQALRMKWWRNQI